MKKISSTLPAKVHILMLLALQLSLIFTFYPSIASAETGYVSDMLILGVREGPGREHNIISTLRSNNAVEILEKKGDYLKIKTEAGYQGWVEGRYISFELPKTVIIENLKNEIEGLQKRRAELEQKVIFIEEENKNLATENSNLNLRNMEIEDINSELEEKNSSLAAHNSDMTRQISQLSGNQEERKEKSTTSSSIDTKQEKEYQNRISALEADLRDEMEKRTSIESELKTVKEQYHDMINSSESENLIRMSQELERLREENLRMSQGRSFTDIFMAGGDDLLKTAMIKWFLSGAGVMIAGWLIGRSFSGSSRRKRGFLN
ncbi:MAG: TIGR04211 family SH3 domain-containing protein [Desulfamplus sp.]|nr:TIGR04211 family SH3 domain-containing protein [Desulfamplus sp.]